MSTSKGPDPTPLTFDDIIHTNPLLFRLHSHKYSHTFFDDDSKILIASNNAEKCKDNSQEIIPTLQDRKKNPTPYETGAVVGHITSWREGDKKPSDFISLTYNFWYVLWEWKRRRGQSKYPRPEEDFQVIVFDSSGLKGRAKLGTEVVDETQNPEAYWFTQAHNEVIVADFIQPPATLGAMSLSQLQGFIPSWCQEQLESVRLVPESEEKKPLRFKPFVGNLRNLNPSTNEVDGVLQSLRFTLELLVPILVTGGHWHQCPDNENAVDSTSTDRPRDEDGTLDRSSHDHVGGLSAGATEGSPTEEGQREVQDTPKSANAEQGGKNPERLRACNYIRAILADIWYMEEMGERKALQETWTDDVDKLLKRYMETIEGYVLHACRGFHS